MYSSLIVENMTHYDCKKSTCFVYTTVFSRQQTSLCIESIELLSYSFRIVYIDIFVTHLSTTLRRLAKKLSLFWNSNHGNCKITEELLSIQPRVDKMFVLKNRYVKKWDGGIIKSTAKLLIVLGGEVTFSRVLSNETHRWARTGPDKSLLHKAWPAGGTISPLVHVERSPPPASQDPDK